MKKLSVILIFLLTANLLKAQGIYDKYVDFNKALFMDDDKSAAFTLAREIIASTEKLPAKTQTNFYAKVAKLYEDRNEPNKAITYWEKVLAAEPDYYVAHRAVAYLYMQQSNLLATKMNASLHDQKLYPVYFAEYKKLIKIVVSHFEKAQACDPDDTTLSNIKRLYTSINDTADFNTLDTRLKEMSKHCVELLTD